MIGQKISHYRIVEKLGEGGMGVVYKAEDLKLGRAVALKFLPSHLLESEEHKARFLHEARAAALLDHPNICTVYEIDEVDGQNFLAMACLEGQTLKQKIAARPLPLPEALDIAMQIGQGLQTAHEKGIVHRDIKPANIMITPQGQVKIMDFGLAQLSDRTKLTATGMKLGTPAYMSPEQTEGKTADRRSDIWSLGVVLYEMVSGRVPFAGEAEAAVAYAIVHTEPEPLSALRTGVPLELDRIVAKSLEKDPAARYQHAADHTTDLRAAAKQTRGFAPGSTPEGLAGQTPAQMRRRLWRERTAFGGLLLLSLAFSLWLWLRPNPPSQPMPVRRFSIVAPEGMAPRISPNGRYIAYGGPNNTLWLHDLSQDRARQLNGMACTAGPFWSPDSSSVACAAGSELLQAEVEQGAVSVICKLPGGLLTGASWGSDGSSVVFTLLGEGVFEAPLRSGEPQRILQHAHAEAPTLLAGAGGKRLLLFAALSPEGTGSHDIVIHSLDSGRQQTLVTSSFALPEPSYSQTGHILYSSGVDGPAVWALPFSLATEGATGDPIRVGGLGIFPNTSSDGTLIYQEADFALQPNQLIWFDRGGNRLQAASEPAASPMRDPAISPDGSRAVVTVVQPGNMHLWIYDLRRPAASRLTFNSTQDWHGIWWPSGDQITFISAQAGGMHVSSKAADGSAQEKILLSPYSDSKSSDPYPATLDGTADGRYLAGAFPQPKTKLDLWYAERKPNGGALTAVAFLETAANETHPRFSPDARHLAYVSDESGRDEVYVRTFPGGEGKWQVSRNGGSQPRWRADGKELFYLEGNAMMAAEVHDTPAFSAGAPSRLFVNNSLNEILYLMGCRYAVSPDGQRFLVVETVPGDHPATIHVVQDWFTEIKDRQR
jgi:serine/threonine protein kinase